MRKKRGLCCRLLLAMALLLCFGGCSMDVDSFLKPPMAHGEQQQIQAALETYLRDSGRSSARYTLQYPSVGKHTAAFVVCDAAGRPVADSSREAAMALAFYSLSAGTEETHINFLRCSGEEWISVGDVTGYGSDILQVGFGDLDGDGMAELFTGWNTYSSREHRLVVFSMGDALTELETELLYTQMYIGDMMSNGRDSLLLFRSGASNSVTAELHTMNEQGLYSVGRTTVDSLIQQYGDMTLCELYDGIRGLYVDVIKTSGEMCTELLYYDGSALQAPFYDAVTGECHATLRDARIPARDIDGDGVMEIPTCKRLTGSNEEQSLPSYAYLTAWRSWDFTQQKWGKALFTVVNTADGYAVTLDEEQREYISTQYDSDTRTLSLYDTEQEKVWMRLCVAEQEREGYFLLHERTREDMACYAWIDRDCLDTEKARYMVLRFD